MLPHTKPRRCCINAPAMQGCSEGQPAAAAAVAPTPCAALSSPPPPCAESAYKGCVQILFTVVLHLFPHPAPPFLSSPRCAESAYKCCVQILFTVVLLLTSVRQP